VTAMGKRCQFLAATLLVCAGCSTNDVGTQTSALEGDGTIPRVQNPPPESDLTNLPGDLRAIAVPGPGAALDEFVKDPVLLVVLGKALFWDMQVGDDGVTACASCHFRAGADPRGKNQLSPGLTHWPSADHTFRGGTGPNHQLDVGDFPLSRLAVPGTRGSLDPNTDNNDVVSSQGVRARMPR